jgi:tetratricopeptide (TPR) repeat protein
MVQSLHTRTDQLLQRAPNDPDLLRSKARLLREQGELVASDSRFVEAEDCFAAAGTIYQSLYARNRNDLQSGRMWAEAAVRIGDIQRAQGDLNAAREHYLDAHASLLRMSDAHAEDISLRDDICWSLDRLASLDHATERHASMLEVLLERRRLSEALLADSPDRVLSRYNVAVGALRIAQYYIFLDDWEQAYDWATLAGPDISAVVAAEPERTHFVMWFVEWTTFIARALDRQGDWQGAAQHVRTSREVVSALWAKARGDWHALWLVLRVHYFAYSSFMGWDEQDEALGALRDGVRILESIPGERSIDAVRELERAILDAAQEHGLAAPVREAP